MSTGPITMPRQRPPKPEWLKIKLTRNESFGRITSALRKRNLYTVCEEANCPNIHECWSGGTATFMILGDICTRGCRFCAVTSGNPGGAIDLEEPENTARMISEMGLRYIVITSVDRDDLDDQGAGHFALTAELTKRYTPGILVETLTPDWRGNEACVRTMAQAPIDVLAHNIETVERLQTSVRDPRAGYQQSLKVLRLYREVAAETGRRVLTKSSIMLGVGETKDEVRQCMQDLLDQGVSVLTLGQYLQPTRKHLSIQEYIPPERFDAWAREGEAMGFAYVAAGPLVRSSYKAGEYYIRHMLTQQATT